MISDFQKLSAEAIFSLVEQKLSKNEFRERIDGHMRGYWCGQLAAVGFIFPKYADRCAELDKRIEEQAYQKEAA